MKLTKKSKLHVGDMLINEKTGTSIILLKKKHVETKTNSPSTYKSAFEIVRKEHKNLQKNKTLKTKKVVWWDTFISTTEKSSINRGFKAHKEKNLREKIERGTLLLVKIKKSK